jgi:hypothetical protein
MLQYCQLYQQSVGEVCLNTYQKLVVEADNGPLLLLLPELWIMKNRSDEKYYAHFRTYQLATIIIVIVIIDRDNRICNNVTIRKAAG